MGRVRNVLLGTAMAVGVAAAGTAPALAETTGERLQAVLDGVRAEHRLVPSASAYVDAPRQGLPWKGASGVFALTQPRPLHPDDPYRIHSTTKILTSAAILRLVEDGRMSLNDKIGRWLPAEIVDRIHVLDGVSYGPRITVRQLLDHTSGIFSHDEDPAFLPLVAAQPTKRWTAEEEIEISMRNRPYFKPGEGWHYSDTAYVMLGLIIQRATSRALGPAVRELVGFDRLGLRTTWWELFEAPPAGARDRAHQYLKVGDSYYHSPSWDSWGGGGLVSTNRDMATFMRALFEGRVFRSPETLRTMLANPHPVPDRGFEYAYEYGLGIGHWRVGGVDCWGHPGFYSSVAHYCPSLDLAFATTTNQASDEHDHHTEPFVAHGIARVVRETAADRAGGQNGCLASRSPIGRRNIGRVRLGYSRRRLLRLPVKPIRRTRRSYSYCVRGSRGRVTAVFGRRGRAVLLTSTGRGHGNRGVRVHARATKFRRAYPGRRRVGHGLYRAGARSTRLIGLRSGRVRFLAVANPRLLGNRRGLRQALRRAGL